MRIIPYTITLIPGDGVGPEITEATTRALEATGVAIKREGHQIEGSNLCTAISENIYVHTRIYYYNNV